LLSREFTPFRVKETLFFNRLGRDSPVTRRVESSLQGSVVSPANLREAYRHFNALRGLVIHHPGGWADSVALARAKEACRAASEAAGDEA
jgi:hypothetical protein